MTQRKDYTLVGIGSSVQYGKGGGQIVWNTDHFEITTDGATLAQVRVPTTPVNDNDAASKIYVDSLASGVDAKNSVRAASTAPGTLAVGFANGDTIDGVVLATGDRILIKNQASNIENGIYTVNATGAPTRATDADQAGDLSGGTFVFIESGTTQADTGWVISTNGSITPGVTGNDWVQFSAAGVISAGVGLSQTGTVFNVNIGATTITVNGTDDLIVNSSATANQILLSAGTVGTEATFGALPLGDANAVTGTLGQANGGLGSDISGFAQNSMLVVGAASTITELAAGTAGNVLIAGAGGVPAYGQVNLADNTNSVTGVLDETNGGTGQSTYTQGDVLVATAANTLSALAIGAANTVLTSNGTDATWQAIPATSGSVTTLVSTIAFGGGATQVIGSIPAGGRVIKVSIDVTTAWDAADTLEIGDSGNISRLMGATANDPEQALIFSTDVDELYAALTTLNATLTTAGATTGAATVIVQYIAP